MELYINLLAAFIFSVLFSWLLLPEVQRICIRKKLFDSPDERKVHTGIVPRLGGVVFFPALLLTFLLILSVNILLQTSLTAFINTELYTELMLILSALLLLYFTGVEDDLINVRYRTKLIIQVVAGVLLTASGIWINNLYGLFGLNEIHAVTGIPLTIFVIVFIINAINFIDGIDGLAAGIGILAFLCYGFIFLHLQLYVYSVLSFSSVGMLVPFFYYNVFGKANRGDKIFMGDSGSLTIGILLSVFAVKVSHYDPNGLHQSSQALVLGFSMLIVPLFDALRVILFRIFSGKSPFKPDKSHMHHQLLQLGFSHKAGMLIILTDVILFGAVTILLIPYLDINLLLGIIVLLWVVQDIYLKRRVKQVVQTVSSN